MMIVANRDIYPGEALTLPYATPPNYVWERQKEVIGFKCTCPRCRQEGEKSNVRKLRKLDKMMKRIRKKDLRIGSKVLFKLLSTFFPFFFFS